MTILSDDEIQLFLTASSIKASQNLIIEFVMAIEDGEMMIMHGVEIVMKMQNHVEYVTMIKVAREMIVSGARVMIFSDNLMLRPRVPNHTMLNLGLPFRRACRPPPSRLPSGGTSGAGVARMIEVIANDRLGGKGELSASLG